MVLYRSLKRFELYNYLNLDTDTFSSEELRKYNSFFVNEYKMFTPDKDGVLRPKQSYVKIFETFKERRPPKPRGIHYIASVEIMLRAFFSWCIKTEKTTNDPFRSYSIKTIEYGTPYYLTLEERDRIYQTDLSSEPQMEILNKYKSTERKSLLPLISSQKYNDYIKQILHTCGIDRMVTVLNPTTGESEQRCIADVASSHIARRTFIGNLYKKVKDPNLVGKLSGHKEGSRAFARYRDIDDEMISDLTNLL